jgi:tagatose 6-phosphate kinase
MRFLTVGLNPTLQRTIQVSSTLHNGVNRALQARHDVAGKAANVARVLGQIGLPVVHLCHAGGANRETWLAGCAADGLSVIAPNAPGEVRTCVTVVERDHGTTTEFIEPSPTVDPETVDAVWNAFQREIENTDVLLVCGSTAPGYPDDIYLRMIDAAAGKGVRIGVDVSGSLLRETVRRRPELVKVNVREFGTTFTPELKDRLAELESKSLSVLEMDDAREKFRVVMARLHGEGTTVVLSQGARPTVVYDPEKDVLTGIDTIRMEPVNTIGCGDTMTAGIAARFFVEDGALTGAALIEAVEYGHTLAAINASLMKPGTIRE